MTFGKTTFTGVTISITINNTMAFIRTTLSTLIE
jgi:hypothetical protein